MDACMNVFLVTVRQALPQEIRFLYMHAVHANKAKNIWLCILAALEHTVSVLSDAMRILPNQCKTKNRQPRRPLAAASIFFTRMLCFHTIHQQAKLVSSVPTCLFVRVR